MLVDHLHLKPCKPSAHTIGQDFGLVSRAEADVVENEQDGGFCAGVFGQGQFDQQLQSPSEPEDHLLSVLPERHVQQQPEPQGQRIRCRNAASTTCLRHGERQELLQEVTLGKIARKKVLTLLFVDFSMK